MKSGRDEGSVYCDSGIGAGKFRVREDSLRVLIVVTSKYIKICMGGMNLSRIPIIIQSCDCLVPRMRHSSSADLEFAVICMRDTPNPSLVHVHRLNSVYP